MNKFTNNEASIYLFAFRYAIRRATGAAVSVVSEILKNWDRFQDFTTELIIHEIECEFELSSDMPNRDEWEKILAKKTK